MCDHCYYGEFFNDDSDLMDDPYVEPSQIESNGVENLDTDSLKLEFIKLLMDDDEGALTVIAEFLEPDLVITRPLPPTEHTYKIFSTDLTPADDGFFHYTIGHDLESENVMVAIDSNGLWSYAVLSDSHINVVSPVNLYDTTVRVYLKENVL